MCKILLTVNRGKMCIFFFPFVSTQEHSSWILESCTHLDYFSRFAIKDRTCWLLRVHLTSCTASHVCKCSLTLTHAHLTPISQTASIPTCCLSSPWVLISNSRCDVILLINNKTMSDVFFLTINIELQKSPSLMRQPFTWAADALKITTRLAETQEH